MVAIVSGNSLGLELTSWRTLGERPASGSITQGRVNETVAVNVATGNLVLQDTDQTLMGRGPDALLLRTYNSQGLRDDDNGDNWRQGVAPRPLQLIGTWGAVGSTVRRTEVDGSVAVHVADALTGNYLCTDGDGAHDVVRKLADGRIEWREGGSGATEIYAGTADGRLLERRDATGNVLSFLYDTQGRLERMRTPAGDALVYAWNANDLSSVSTVRADGTVADITRYVYDANHRLTQVTVDLSPADGSVVDGKVYVTSYAYDSAGRISGITQSDGSTLAIEYVTFGGRDRVFRLRDGLGQVTSLSYALSDGAPGYTTVTDPSGWVTRFDVDAKGQLTAITPPAVDGRSPVTRFAWDAQGNLVSRTDGEGRVTSTAYDSMGNPTVERDSLGNLVVRTFNAANQLRSEIRHLVPDPDGTGPATASGALTRWLVYDATTPSLPRYIIEADGSVTEHRYNGWGERVATLQFADRMAVPLSVPTSEQMASWVAAQTKTSARRTDFTYDARGQLFTSTTWARLSADGSGVADGSESVVRHVRDAAGRLLQIVASDAGTTTFSYDGLGRELTRTDALGTVSVTEYLDAARTTRWQIGSGVVTTSVWDVAGRLAATTETSTSGVLLGETRHWYDASGRLRMTQDPVGARRWFFWDAAGRLAGEIDALGACTAYTYDASGRVLEVRRSAIAANVASLVDVAGQPVTNLALSSVMPAANASDGRELRSYDAAGRLLRTARSIGTGTSFAVTAQRYDGLGRLIGTLAYANPVSVAAGVTAIPVPAVSDADRLTRQFWDDAGRLVGRLDAEGALQTWTWDATGRCVEACAWATWTSAALRETGTLAQLLPAKAAEDQRTWRWHDAAGREIAQLDPEGYLTETVYDNAGRVTLIVRYATLSPATAPTSATTIAQLRPATSPLDVTTSRTWDALGRLLSETSEGVTTQFTYDAQGRLLSTVRAAGTDESRSLLARYDLQGRLVGELAGEGAAQLAGGQTQEQVDAIWAQWGVRHTYDAAGRRLSTSDAASGTRWFFYDAAGALTHTVNALGEVTGSRYDAMGRLVERLVWDMRVATAGLSGGTLPTAVATALGTASVLERFTYTRAGEVLTQTDANSVTVTRERNAFGEVVRQTTPTSPGAVLEILSTRDRMGRVTTEKTGPSGASALAVRSTAYDAFGRVIAMVDPMGMQISQSWDHLGRLQIVRDPRTGSRYTIYDAFGRVAGQAGANMALTRYTWDPVTRSMAVRSPLGLVTTSTYNRFGQVIQVTDPTGQVSSWRYDRNGRLLQRSGPEGTGSRSEYDKGGREIAQVDANGVRTVFTYDAVGRTLTSTQDPAGLALQTTWTWDARGRRVSQRDASGVVTNWTYDARNRMLRQAVDPAGLNLQTVWAYDNQDRVLTVSDPGGVVTATTFDILGRRVREQVGPAALGQVRTWTWDAADNLLSATDATGATTRYVNDAAGRPVFTIDPLGQVRQTSRDALGRVTRIVTYAQSLNDAATLPAVPTVADVEARLVAQPDLDQVEHRVFDRANQLVATVDATGAVVRFTYDAAGRVIARTAFANRIDLRSWTVGTVPAPAADPARDEQLSTVYDGAGRVLYTVDGTGALVSNRWDAAGNLLQRTAHARTIPSGTALTAQALATAASSVADTSQDVTERHVYDAAGRRTWSADGTGAVTRRTFDAGGRVIRSVRYANPVGSADAPSAVVASAQDAVSLSAYDAAGRLVFEVDPAGAVTESSLNANGQVTRLTRYSTVATSVLTLVGPTLADVRAARVTSGQDRSTWQSFDAAGRAIFSVDATGAITERVLDASGRETRRIAWATQIGTSSLGAAPSVDQVRSLLRVDPGDRTTRSLLDAAGRLGAEIDATGAVRAYQYDGVGRLVSTTLFARRITDPAVQTLAQLRGVLTSDPTDRTEIRTWNAAGHLVALTDALGNTERYARDAIGRQTAFTNKLNVTWTYELDAAGRQISETTPSVLVARLSTTATGGITDDPGVLTTIVTRQVWDALGRLTQRIEAHGTSQQRTTRYAYDAAGRQVRVTLPAVQVYDLARETRESLATNGFGAIASRVETEQLLETRTLYDAFGNAVVNADVGGAIARKVYDAQGRVIYEMDPLGRVTRYQRNAFGDVVALTRYGQALSSLVPAGLSAPNLNLTRAGLESALAAPSISHAADRTITTSHDKLGRAVEVTEPLVHVDGVAGAATGRVMATQYDAFGQVVQTSVLRSVAGVIDRSPVAVTTRYWDAAGRERATVDALGYLTTRSFDVAGNLVQTIEHATALATGAWTLKTYQAPAVSLDDRITRQTWDALNRRTSETRAGIEFSGDTRGTSQRGDAVTRWTYDALGNVTSVTDAEGGVTRTAHDALGRVRLVAGPARTLDTGATVTPLTSFLRDAYGNVSVRIEHSAAVDIGTGPLDAPARAATDRVTRSLHDAHGREVQSVDALGGSVFQSYDAWGHLAKRWQTVADVDGNLRTLFQRDEYDKAGQLVISRTPGTTVTGSTPSPVVSVHTAWNAFGEMTSRQTDDGAAEVFDWDNAGRLWRTNSGDGITRIQLFDVQGQVTTELRSDGAGGSNVDLKTFLTASSAAAASGLRRTTYVRDALGRVVKTLQPERALPPSNAVVRNVDAHVLLMESAIATVRNENGLFQYAGTNRMSVRWNNLAQLGSGDFSVEIDYLSVRPVENGDARLSFDGQVRTRTSAAVVADAAAGELQLAWTDPPGNDGGVGRILRLRILKADLSGQPRQVYDSGTAAGRMAIEITTPANTLEQVKLEVRRADSTGSLGWFTVPKESLVDFGDVTRFDPGPLGLGRWEYRASALLPDNTLRPLGSGTFVVSQDVLGVISADIGVDRSGTDIGVLSWVTPGVLNTQTFRYRTAGSTAAWSTMTVSRWGLAARDGVNLKGLVAGSYEYELLWSDAGSAQIRQHATGTFAVNAPQPSRQVPAVNMPVFEGLSLGRGFNGIRMVDALNLATAMPPQVTFRPVGGSWTALRVTNSTIYLGPDNSSDYLQALLPDGLAPGSYEIRVLTDDPSQATALYTVPPPVPGYYTTETYTVGVQVQVGVDEAGNPIMEWHDETRTRSVWVSGYQPDASFSITTPPYTPPYWLPPVPASYGVVVSTAAGGAATSGSGASAAQGAVTAADARPVRPEISQTLDRWGNVVSISDPRSASWITRSTYNVFNQVTSTSTPDSDGLASAASPVKRWYFDRLGRQVATRDARGHVNGQRWNAAGQLVEEGHADTGVIRHAYDVLGNRTRTVDAEGWTTRIVYDILGRKTELLNQEMSRSGALTRTWSWTYDAAGRMLSQADGLGAVTRYVWDLRGNLAQTRQPMGQMTQTVWDAYGRKSRETDANGAVTSWAHDAFGQLRARWDIAGGVTDFTYDQARQLITQVSERGQRLVHSYDAAGQLLGISDAANQKKTSYQYDLGGRRIRERTEQKGAVYQDNHLAWDARGLLRSIADSRSMVTMDYDAEGNRTHVFTRVSYQGLEGAVRTETHRWNRYDEMNRQILVDAATETGDPGAQAHELRYDRNGNRVADVSQGPHVVPNQPQMIIGWDETGKAIYANLPVTYVSQVGRVTESYAYDGRNRLFSVTRDGVQIDRRTYDGAGRLTRQGPDGQPQAYMDALNAGLPAGQTNGQEIRTFDYDANGRLLLQRVMDAKGTLRSETVWSPVVAAQLGIATAGTIGYDAVGNTLGYAVRNAAQGDTPRHVNTYLNTILRRESYLQAGTTASSTWLRSGTTTQNYDVNGFLTSFTDSAQAGNNRTFVNDAEGRALWVNQDGRVQRQLIANGEVLGTYGVTVDANTPSTGADRAPKFVQGQDFGFGYARVSASYPAPSTGNYTVRAGDTLQGIARSAYGDSRQWFRVAEANGLSGPGDLKVGQTLRLPSLPGGASNDATTFRTYDPSRMTGDMSPTLLAPLPGGCGSTGKLLMMVVAVVVFAYTMQAQAIGSLWSSILGAEASPLLVKAAVTATAAVASNVASQVVGLATGDVKRFDWRSVALSAVGGAITGGLEAGMFGKALQGNLLPNVVARAAVANAMTQGIAVISGMQKKFDWRAVAAAAVGSAIGGAMREGMGSLDGVEGVLKLTGVGLVAGLAATAARGGRVSVGQAMVDGFGNALGQSIANQVNSPDAQGMGAAPSRDSGNIAGGIKVGGDSYGLRMSSSARTVFSSDVDVGIQASVNAMTGPKDGVFVAGSTDGIDWTTVLGGGVPIPNAPLPDGPIKDRLSEKFKNGFLKDPVEGLKGSIKAVTTRTLQSVLQASGYAAGADPNLAIAEGLGWVAPRTGALIRQGSAGIRVPYAQYSNSIQADAGDLTGVAMVVGGGYSLVSGAIGLGARASAGSFALDYATFRANFVGPPLGKSGFISTSELGDASFLRYQGYVDDAYAAAISAEAKGLLKGNSNTRIGTAVDQQSAARFGRWLDSEGVPEGVRGVVQMNRWLRDPGGTGLYVRPDIRIPGASLSLDATVGLKWSTDTQIMRFSSFSGGDRVIIVRPQQLGGSYSIWPR